MSNLSCIFCRNSKNQENLIDINQNAVEFDNFIIEFSDIVEDIFCKQIKNKETALICETCKDLLVQFFVFSENIKNNVVNFAENKNIEKCKKYLNECEENVNCFEYNDCLLLIPDSKSDILETLEQLEPVSNENIQQLEVNEEDYKVVESLIETEDCLNDEIDFDLECSSNTIEQNISEDSVNIQDEEEEMEQDNNMCTDSTFNCSKCDFITEDQSEYNQHITIHVDSSTKRYVKLFCERCSYQFTTHAHYTAHNNGHKIFDTLAQYMNYPKCENCNIMFIDDESYENHSINHNDEPIESVGFFLKFGIKRDDEKCEDSSLIVNADSPKCGHCLNHQKNDEELVKHLIIFHAKTLICPVDLRSFKNNHAYTIHMRNNHPELFPNSSFVCSVCKNEFETLYEKLSHMKVCKAKSFNCLHCDKSFSRKCHLVKHLKLVSGELNITCEKCSKVCRDKHDYKIHSRSHSTEKIFSCSLCPKTYKTSSARAAHLQSHLDKILCPHCNLQFKSRRTMQKHVKTKHKKNEKHMTDLQEIEVYSI